MNHVNNFCTAQPPSLTSLHHISLAILRHLNASEWWHHQDMPFKMNFILLTFTGTTLTLILHPLHVYTVQMQQNKKNKKQKNNLQVPVVRLERGSSRQRASAVQQKIYIYILFDPGGFPVGTPGTVETTAETDGPRQPQTAWQNPPWLLHEDGRTMLMQMWNLQISTTFKHQRG